VANDQQWHHLAASYDGTTVRWYADGALLGSVDIALNTHNNVHIGKRADNDNFFTGLIDEVKIYDYALSDPEIAHLVGLGPVYVELVSPANVYDAEPTHSKFVNFKDFAKVAAKWLVEELWPR